MNAPYPPPNRAHDMSPASFGSEWSAGNTYHSAGRSDSPYGAYARNDSTPPSDVGMPNGSFPFRPNYGYAPPPPSEPFQRRRPSETGSQLSSRAVSLAHSRSSDGTISDVQSKKYRRMEQELSQHYTILRAYLRGGAAAPPRPNKARDKLLRLSPVQFHELSTDVFDELQRRQAMTPIPGKPPRRDIPPFLQPRPDFHEKRNQARQKLSSLQTVRFKDLSTDVYCELERRFPQFSKTDDQGREGVRSQSRGPTGRVPGGPGGPNGYGPGPRMHNQGPSIGNGYGNGAAPPYGQTQHGSDYGRPQPKQFQSNTITPNKSTMVEDEDELQGVDSRFDRESDAFGLENHLASPKSDRDLASTPKSNASAGLIDRINESKVAVLQKEVAQLKESLKIKDEEVQQAQASAEAVAARPNIERKLLEAEQRNNLLQEELALTQAQQAAPRQDEHLQRENRSLQGRLKQQQEIIDDVSRQGQLYLEEMRAMAESGGGNFEREDKLQADIQRLESELKEWKAKYVRAKTQLRSVRTNSLGLNLSKAEFNRSGRDESLYDPSGAVKDIHVTKFQIAIDELLQIARSGEPRAVLEHMKTVVLAVRNITTDIDQSASFDKDEEMIRRRIKLRSRVSATANNVITASKNYSAAGGLSPVSLLDAAASHLTAAVVDLIKTVKINPTPISELEDDDDDGLLEPLQSNGYFDVSQTMRRKSAVESVYSALSSPRQPPVAPEVVQPTRNRAYTNASSTRTGLGIETAGYGRLRNGSDLEDLKIHIEDQSDHLVESIQVLIEAIRADKPISGIRSNLIRIADTVDAVVAATEKASNDNSWYQKEWHAQTISVLQNLKDCQTRLSEACDEAQAHTDQASAKSYTQKLPPLAFQVAREVRDLVRRVQIIKGTEGEEDFS